MAQRYIHCIDHRGLHSFAANGSRIELRARFDGSEVGAGDFSIWLGKNVRGIHTLLVDVPEEGFQIETIPYVPWTDRRALVSRKLNQLFFGSPYCTAISLGREKIGRRDERVLFAALTRPAVVEPWLKALRQRDAAVAAVYTVPLLTKQLLAGLSLDKEVSRGLIVTFSQSGIRQTFFDDRQLRFSRLSPAPEGPFSDWGAACLRETQKTWQYLSTQRWIGRDEAMPAWLLLERSDFAPVLADLKSTPSVTFHPINLDTLTQRHGDRYPGSGSDCRQLMLHLALRETRGPQMAPLPDRQVFRLWQLRSAITAVGILGGVSLGVWGLKYFVDASALADRTHVLQLQRESVDRRYQSLMASLPHIPTSLEELRAAVARIDQIAGSGGSPVDALVPLSRVLDRYLDVEVRHIAWQQENPPEVQAGSLEGEGKTKAGVTRFVMVIDAALPAAAASNPRAALTRIRAFSADLRSQVPGTEVTLPRQPFDAEPDKTLRSDTDSAHRAPEFQLRWIMTKADRP